MSVLAFAAGLSIAPAVMAAYGLVDAVAARGTAAEAFSWITTAVFAGFSVGMALGGTLIEALGVRASFGLGVAAAGVGAVLVALGPGLEER
jgi:MFS family permease